MESFLWNVAMVFIGVVVSVVFFIASRLYEWWKPIYFRVVSWQLNFKGEIDYCTGKTCLYKPGDKNGSAGCHG